jgi:hypothetical protein
MKNLVGKVEFGTPSAFYIRREVRAIKQLAEKFASQSGDPAFYGMVAKAMDAEAKTVSRRKSAIAARQAG